MNQNLYSLFESRFPADLGKPLLLLDNGGTLVAHPDFGEAVTAVVVPCAGGPRPTEAGIIAALKRRLANFKIPKRVYVVDELPRNAMGKVQKNVLRERYKP